MQWIHNSNKQIQVYTQYILILFNKKGEKVYFRHNWKYSFRGVNKLQTIRSGGIQH